MMRTTMRFLAGMLLSGVLALLLTSGPVDAQKKSDAQPSAEETAEAQRQTIDDVMTAYRLIEFGEKNKAPEALITAASLFRKLARVEMNACSEKPDITADPEGGKSDLVDQEAGRRTLTYRPTRCSPRRSSWATSSS